jgi:hypothetical protein
MRGDGEGSTVLLLSLLCIGMYGEQKNKIKNTTIILWSVSLQSGPRATDPLNPFSTPSLFSDLRRGH